MGAEIREYLERIDATLAAHGGRFLVHGSKATPVEGDWEGDAIVVEFPSPAALRAWYRSPEYQAILPLRSENSDSTVVLLDGAGEYHRATDILA
ncbi:DUF1330 domain-containing protein [Rhodococcus sp. HNM0569]|nr:DUF1330 domain-containing protein [Rhodococcus sp. HNM0569]